jgi:hypothetical protein
VLDWRSRFGMGGVDWVWGRCGFGIGISGLDWEVIWLGSGGGLGVGISDIGSFFSFFLAVGCSGSSFGPVVLVLVVAGVVFSGS